MGLSTSLRTKLTAAAGGGAMLIATLFLGGKDGVEGRAYRPYRDVAGVWTVCDGHTGDDIVTGKKYSDRECDLLLKNDLRPVKRRVDALVSVPLGEYQQAALYSFAYNAGIGAFSRSTLLKKLNAGDLRGGCEELSRWIYAGGKSWPGLSNRRDAEKSLCLAEAADDLAVK